MGEVSTTCLPSQIASPVLHSSMTTTATTTTTSAPSYRPTLRIQKNPDKTHKEGCECPYCIVWARRGTLPRTKITFNAYSANLRKIGQHSVSTLNCIVAETIGCPTPLVNLRVCIKKQGNHNKLANIRALLDTGASIDIITAKFAK